MLAGLVLAGGQSQRMGQDKSYLTLPKSNQSLLDHSCHFLSKVCKPVLVSGAQHENGIVDIYPGCGPLSGIHAVIKHIKSKYVDMNELMVIPVDMPSLGGGELERLLKVGREKGSAAYFEEFYFPLYLPINQQIIDYLEDILGNPNSKGHSIGKSKQYSIRNMIMHLQGHSLKPLKPKSFKNINTPEQWQVHCSTSYEKINNES